MEKKQLKEFMGVRRYNHLKSPEILCCVRGGLIG